MISRRTFLMGATLFPLAAKMSQATAASYTPDLGLNTLYPIQIGNLEGHALKILSPKVSSLDRGNNSWASPLPIVEPVGAVLIDLRRGIAAMGLNNKIETKIIESQLTPMGISVLGGKLMSDYAVSGAFLPFSLSFLGLISRKSVKLGVQTNFSSMQNMKVFISNLENLLKRGFQPLVIGNKENLTGPLFFSTLSLALNSSKFHDSLLSRKVRWNSQQMVKVFELLYNLKKFMNKSVNDMSWTRAHKAVIDGDAIATFGAVDFAQKISLWNANDLAIDALSFPNSSLQTREIETMLQGFVFSRNLEATMIESLITKMISLDLQRSFMNEFPHKLLFSAAGARPWPGIAVEQSRWKSRRFEPVTSLALSLPPQFVSSTLAPAIQEVFDLKSPKQILNLCSKIQNDWQRL